MYFSNIISHKLMKKSPFIIDIKNELSKTLLHC